VLRQPKSRSFAARTYHRHHPWRLSRTGLYVPHAYPEAMAQSPSWWDDFGFVYAKRRVMVWWRHPRLVYLDTLEDKARDACSVLRPENLGPLFDQRKPLRVRVGEGARRKIKGYRIASFTPEWEAYFTEVDQRRRQLADTDLGIAIPPSFSYEWLSWAQGVSLVLPFEVRCEADLLDLSRIVRGLLRGDRTPLQQPPYTFAQWSADGGSALLRQSLSGQSHLCAGY